jgi:hypothetical protein
MKEIVLRMFFEGAATATELAADVIGTRTLDEPRGFRSSSNYAVEPMARPFDVQPEHIVRLVDAVLTRTLTSQVLGDLAFCMEAAPERWRWNVDEPEGERVSSALFWLGTPEVNYPLTDSVLRKIKTYLETGENTLSGSDLTEPPA